MSQQQAATSSPSIAFKLDDINNFGQKQANAFMAMQHEFAAWFDEASKGWAARAELEKELTSELFTRLSSAKTITDGAQIYQDWLNRHLQVWAEDSRKAMADSQKLVAVAARCMSGQDLKN